MNQNFSLDYLLSVVLEFTIGSEYFDLAIGLPFTSSTHFTIGSEYVDFASKMLSTGSTHFTTGSDYPDLATRIRSTGSTQTPTGSHLPWLPSIHFSSTLLCQDFFGLFTYRSTLFLYCICCRIHTLVAYETISK